jgi:hypothetical protein
VAFFIWTAALGNILTTDNLQKRRIIILDWCCMCSQMVSPANHLLMHCPVAQELWNMTFILFGVSWAMPTGVVDLLSCWTGRLGKSMAGRIWNVIPHFIMWCLWCERNARTFEGGGNFNTSTEIPVLADTVQLVKGLTANHFEFFVRKARFMLCLSLIFVFFACSLLVYMFVSSLFDQ